MSKLVRLAKAAHQSCYVDEDQDYDDDYHNEGGEDSKYKDDIDKYESPFKPEKDADGNYKNPVIEMSRGCTDIQCVILYWAFMGAMLFAVYYGYTNGEFYKLIAPVDADTQLCGFGDQKGYPKMLFSDFSVTEVTSILKSGVCVSECPASKDHVFKEGENCKDNANKKCSDLRSYETMEFVVYCLPVNSNGLSKEEWAHVKMVKEAFMASKAGTIFNDLYNSSRAVYWSMGLAFFWSILFIYIMSIFAEGIAWCCVILVQLGLIAATIGCYFLWEKANKDKTLLKEEATTDEAKKKADEDKTPMYTFIAMCVFGVLTFVFLCLLICKRKALKRAIDVIDAAADYVRETKRVLGVPIVHTFFQMIVVAVWFGGYLAVISLNDVEVDTLFPQGKKLKWKKQVTYAALGMFFGVLWMTAVIDYTSRFVIIMGACTYYFNNHRDQKDVQKGANMTFAFKTAYINHHGSIAFAAFIIACVKFIKYLFYYFAKKLEKLSGENPMVKCMVKCAGCILECIEKIVDYINANALCYQAVTGQWFCTAAWDGFILAMKHGAEFVFVKIISKVFIFIGKVGITVGNCFCCYAIMKFITKDLEELSSIWTPILLVGAVTFLTASLFLALYEEAVQSLLVCVCVDMDVHGSGLNPGDPRYGPETFHDDYEKKVKNKDYDDGMDSKGKKKTNKMDD